MKKMNPISTINQDWRDKILEVKNGFLKSGIEPQDLKSANLALSSEGDIIVIDYGNFTSR
ncbi:hypothetical protein [Halobacillus amylolyticus]|uniref:Uncharacterized protein n=1 Tax=Halobacillus amylolyticus TaxID=2932259 RepID=A0ABY4HJR3_9BACI|nr:hypothetical protein [Halobacillus amylolyticus]UOR13730.1 hypothetical protein MUO15_09965 [Halobacillus amylolyticus]